MKYVKLSSLLVLSLLLFAPAAQADVECELESESYDLRARACTKCSALWRCGASGSRMTS